MYELLYMSVSPEGFTQTALEELLIVSREKNKRSEITGMLVYFEHEFMQLLEGEKEAVQSLFQTILEDPRHKSVEVFYEGDIENRAFSDWSMAFQTLNKDDLNELLAGQERFDLAALPRHLLKASPNRGKKAFLLLRDRL